MGRVFEGLHHLRHPDRVCQSDQVCMDEHSLLIILRFKNMLRCQMVALAIYLKEASLMRRDTSQDLRHPRERLLSCPKDQPCHLDNLQRRHSMRGGRPITASRGRTRMSLQAPWLLVVQLLAGHRQLKEVE